ncbi:integrase [Agrobacterium tumefaciens]|uniref:integrase n=1 Tax=Agrobacterium tumefaciens TaxID=358 RepID=UPI0015741667|nr:integrase [Agrobacterium tumefaciens]NTA41135.1 transposase family protein [Agrobacterium tumefaciens]WIE32650.1 integrase [Agrobacterium tumefaciens]
MTEYTPITEMGPLDRFTYRGTNWVPIDYDHKEYRFQRETDHRFETRISHAEIRQALKNEMASVHYNFHTKTETKLRHLVGDKHVDDFKPRDVAIARFHEALILRYEQHCAENGRKFPRSEKLAALLKRWSLEIQIEAQELTEQGGTKRKTRCDASTSFFNTPSVRSFNRHFRLYMSCGRDVRALIYRRNGPGFRNSKVECAESYAIWLDEARNYASRRKPSKAKLLRDVNARVAEENVKRVGKAPLIAPGRKRFEALIDAMDEYEVVAGREGLPFARAMFKPKMDSYDIERPGERVEMDDWNADAMTSMQACGFWQMLPASIQEYLIENPQRIWFCGAVDTSANYVLALKGARNPSSALVVDTLEMVMTDKTHIAKLVGAKTPWFGVRPEVVYTDNGAPYIADATRDAFLMCKIALTRPPAGQAWKRPFIESLFKTLARDIMMFFDGRTFSNIVEKNDYSPEENAALAVDEFINLLIRAVCDIHHNRPSARLNNLTPHETWIQKTKTYRVRAMPGIHEKRHIFGVTKERVIDSAGITVHGIPYNSDTLQTVRRKDSSKPYKVRTHRNDLSAVSVFTGEGWLTVENRIRIPRGVTLTEWYLAKQDLNRRNGVKSEANLPIMYEAINVLRRAGTSAAIRAGISLHTLRPEEISDATDQLFEGRPFTEEQACNEVTLRDEEIAYDPLHDGFVGPQGGEFAGPQISGQMQENATEASLYSDDDSDEPSNFGEIE